MSYTLHQLPEDVWWRTSYDECLDLLELHKRANGNASPDGAGVEALHDFDREQIAAVKAEQARKAA